MNKKSVLQWLEDSVRNYPEKVAFTDPASELTYLQLGINAQKVGSFLGTKISMNEPVSFYLEKSTIAIAGMFGAVYAGGLLRLPALGDLLGHPGRLCSCHSIFAGIGRSAVAG